MNAEWGAMPTTTYILDADGTPVPEPDIRRWGEWFQTHDRQLAETLVEHGPSGAKCRISTVFLGIDHNMHFEGPPVLWETMTFGLRTELQVRYTSRADALAGHAEAVARIGEMLEFIGARRGGP